MTNIIDKEFIEGYMDGYDLDCPEPNNNRHSAYVHSFKIGRAEKLGLPTPSYSVSKARAQMIKDNCR